MPEALRLPKPNLMLKFSLVAILPIALLGLVLQHMLAGQIRHRSLSEARRSAALIAEVGIQPQVSPLDFRRGMTEERAVSLGQPLQSGLASSEIERLKIWNKTGTVIYSNDRALTGKHYPISSELRQALRGGVSSEIERDSTDNPDLHGQKLLAVYVPI